MKTYYTQLQSVGLAALLALGLSSQTQAATFTIDPSSLNATLGITAPSGPIIASSIDGSFSTLVDLPGVIAGPGNDGHGEGFINFSGFRDAGNLLIGAGISGLSVDYEMWAEFSYDIELVSGVYGATNSTYAVSNLDFTLWTDKFGETVFSATGVAGASGLGGTPTAIHSLTAIQLASDDGNFFGGVANINALGGTGFNSTTGFELTNPNGPLFFTQPDPFHNLSFNEFNNTSSFVEGGPGVGFFSLNGSGSVDFNSVPEPSVLALLAVGLIGFGSMAKRRRS